MDMKECHGKVFRFQGKNHIKIELKQINRDSGTNSFKS